MFRKLLQWWRGQLTAQKEFDTAVFRFSIRGVEYCVDPVVIRRKLIAADPKWDELVDSLALFQEPLPPGTPEQLIAARQVRFEKVASRVAEIVSQAFGIPPLQNDGTGATESDRLYVIALYLDYCGTVMRDTLPLAVSPRPTA